MNAEQDLVVLQQLLAETLQRQGEAIQFEEEQKAAIILLDQQINQRNTQKLVVLKQLDIKQGQLAELQHSISRLQELIAEHTPKEPAPDNPPTDSEEEKPPEE